MASTPVPGLRIHTGQGFSSCRKRCHSRNMGNHLGRTCLSTSPNMQANTVTLENRRSTTSKRCSAAVQNLAGTFIVLGRYLRPTHYHMANRAAHRPHPYLTVSVGPWHRESKGAPSHCIAWADQSLVSKTPGSSQLPSLRLSVSRGLQAITGLRVTQPADFKLRLAGRICGLAESQDPGIHGNPKTLKPPHPPPQTPKPRNPNPLNP